MVVQCAGGRIAAFTGNHGRFWRNCDATVTITLRVTGSYTEIKRFD